MDVAPIRAQLYDGHTAAVRAVTVRLTGVAEYSRVRVSGDGIDEAPFLRDVRIGERVGSTNRLLELPGHATLEVLDNEAFDAALRATGVRTAEQGLRGLEGRWRTALILGASALVGVGAFLWLGLPALADRAVALIPPSADTYIGEDTLRVLDKTTFEPSALASTRQVKLRAELAEITHDHQWPGAAPTLAFRRGGAIRANAIALPSGVIVLTDELVALSKDDDELRGVLAHEVGHVAHRHALRMLVQSSASTLLLAGVFGDVSGAAPLTAAAPAILVNAAYSRDFERQADDFAFAWMARHHIPPARLADLLERLGANSGGENGGFLASHPDIEERVRVAHRN